MKLDPLALLTRFLTSREDREAELMAANARNLERAREADRRLVEALAALRKITEKSDDWTALQIAEDALADVTCQATAVEIACSILVNASHGAALTAGWWTNIRTGESLLGTRNVPEMLMLAVSEIAEAMEGHRKGLMDDKLPDRPMIEVEIADCIIRLTDTCGALGLDLGGAMAAKMAFNASRPDHKPEARLAAGGKAY
jgi:NTP pyrophosphatase (non-canonical NTP hydrolase)